jgi:hypothetical protein
MPRYQPLILVLPTAAYLVKGGCHWEHDWPYRIISVQVIDGERCRVVLKGRPAVT